MTRKGPDKRKKPGQVRDFHLWQEVGKSVSPIKRRKTNDPKALLDELEAALNPKPEPARRPPVPARTPPPFAPAPRVPRPPAPEKRIEPGLRRRVERGQLPIDGTLDLHGMTQAGAEAALRRFIPARAKRGDRTVLVITGKGLKKTGYLQIEQRGVLRTMVPIWLGDPDLAPFVAGIDRAHQSHGGEGALYVRLKRQREDRR